MFKKIRLTQGKTALVDAEDYDKVKEFSWYVVQDSVNRRFYAQRWALKEEREKSGRLKYAIPMHIQILGFKKGMRVDHVNPEKTLDNRKSNLRHATASQNGANRGAPPNNTSGFKGVSFSKQRHKWRAYLKLNRKQIPLGFFENSQSAAKAYDAAALKAFGEFAHLNFPSTTASVPSIEYGYCQCGCGAKTTVAPRSKTSQGYIKGVPYRFLPGHRPTYSTLDEKIQRAGSSAARSVGL